MAAKYHVVYGRNNMPLERGYKTADSATAAIKRAKELARNYKYGYGVWEMNYDYTGKNPKPVKIATVDETGKVTRLNPARGRNRRRNPGPAATRTGMELLQSAGRDEGRRVYHSTGVQPTRVSSETIGSYFETWWRHSAPDYSGGLGQFGSKADAKKAYTRAFRNAYRDNPASDAAALYESWTGEPSTHETIVEETIYEHGHLTDLARLVAFKLRGVRGQLKFTDPSTRLCSSESGRQLYIRGGDQQIDLDDFNSATRRPVDPTKDSVVLGEIEYVYYSAKKPFLGGEHKRTGVYKHRLGEESGNRPVLIYDTRAGLLSISGGSYYIKRGDYDGKHSRGIVD